MTDQVILEGQNVLTHFSHLLLQLSFHLHHLRLNLLPTNMTDLHKFRDKHQVASVHHCERIKIDAHFNSDTLEAFLKEFDSYTG